MITYEKQKVISDDGGVTSLGTTTDVEATGDGSLIAILKRCRTLLAALVVGVVVTSGTITLTNSTFGVTNWIGSTAPSVGSKTSANSLPVVIASDQGAVTVSGTVTANAGSGTLAVSGAKPTVTVPAVADILSGTQAQTATTAATTIITITANKTWIGTIGCAVDVAIAAASTTAGQALCTITTAGTNVTPAAGTYLTCEARAGANAASGLVGTQGHNYCVIPFIVNAPAGNTVTIQLASTQAGTNSRVAAYAIGVMN